MPVNRERPVRGLSQRKSEPAGICASDTPGRTVPCRQCGTPTLISGGSVDAWAWSNRTLRSRGQPPLGPDEVAVCGGDACVGAERDANRALLDRERREVDAIVARIRAGQRVHVPSYIRRERPSDYAEIAAALKRHTREGTGTDAELD